MRLKGKVSEMTHAEWRSTLGASDAPAIAGLNPWRTPMAVFLEKTGAVPAFEGNERTEIGLEVQGAILRMFSRRVGLEVAPNENVYLHYDYPFISATPDAFCVETLSTPPVEVKNVGINLAKKWREGIPDDAHIQLMQQMAVCHSDHGYAVALIAGSAIVHYRVERDEKVIQKIIEIEHRFWDLLESKTPPPLTEHDDAYISSLYPQDDGREVILPESAAAWLLQYTQASEQERRAEKLKKQARAELLSLIGSARRGKLGQYIIDFRTVSRAAHTVKSSVHRQISITTESVSHGDKQQRAIS